MEVRLMYMFMEQKPDIIFIQEEITKKGENIDSTVNIEIKPYHLPDIDAKAYEPYKPQRDRKQEQLRRKYHNRKK